MKTHIIKPFLFLILFSLVSCFKYKEEDTEYKELQKISPESLTKLSLNNFIDVDTIVNKDFKTSFKIKNIGNKTMNNIFIKGICECTSFSEYKTSLLPNEEQSTEVSINLDQEKGNFLKEIFLYGTFYPYTRKIQIIGFKK